jgi:hypothetical protein
MNASVDKAIDVDGTCRHREMRTRARRADAFVFVKTQSRAGSSCRRSKIVARHRSRGVAENDSPAFDDRTLERRIAAKNSALRSSPVNLSPVRGRDFRIGKG